jgi:tryptophan-rich sensory protein
MNKPLKFIISISIPLLAGAVGSYFTLPSINNWYVLLRKPFFTPPSSIFAPIWTVLYILMGLSLFIVWSNGRAKVKKNKQEGIRLFWAQLTLNVFWSYAFFTLHSLVLSAAVIVVLWILVLGTINVFGRVSRTASYLLYPYIAWITFATMLNIGFLILNP